VPKAYEYAWNDEFIAMNGFASALSDSVGAVSRFLDTREEGIPVVVYNPLAIARTDLVEMVLPDGLGNATVLSVVNGIGEAVPSQIVAGSDGRAHALFMADVPSVGFAVYGVSPRFGGIRQGRGEATPSRLQNERYRVTVNTAGDVSSIYDLVAGRELLAAPIRLAFLTEWPSEFPAWNMDWADRRQEPRGFVEGAPRVRVIENGPLRYALQIDRESENSSFREVIRLGSGDTSERVEFVQHIDWRARECSLKATFPLAVSNNRATYNWEPGAVQRGNNQATQYEVPSHGWFDLSESSGGYGITVLSGAKYGSDKPNDNTLRLTLLYTPATTDEYCEQRSQDIGRHDIAFGLVGHSGPLSKSLAHWQAQRFEQPLLAFAVSRHSGSLGKQFGWITPDHKEASVQALKRTEDGKSTLLRLQELEGKATAIKLQTHSAVSSAAEANGLERGLGPLESSRNEVSLRLGPYQLQSVRLSTQPNTSVSGPESLPLELSYNVDAVSWNYAREDGDLDGAGASLPAEMLPNTVTAGAVKYRMGPFTNGQKNALVPRGQVVELPRGYTRVGLLMARAYGSHKSVFAFGNTTRTIEVASWNGFLGQWDNRVFDGPVPDVSYCIDNVVRRLEPAYVHTDRLAWYASHYHRRDGGDALYAYSYLFSYMMDIPPGETQLSLPNDEGLRVFAMSVMRGDDSDAVALTPLYPEFTRDGSFAQRFGALP
jgi:alpha-mannosidase